MGNCSWAGPSWARSVRCLNPCHHGWRSRDSLIVSIYWRSMMSPFDRCQRRRPAFWPALLLLIPFQPIAAQVAPRDSADLVHLTQALLDAVTAGDTALWARHLAPDWFLTDEEGEHLSRQDFLAGLQPLPAGQQGRLTLANPHLVGAPGVVVISYDADEEHHFHGQLLRTRFHSTDTYRLAAGRWLQLASQVTALPRAAQGYAVPRRLLHEYAGSYALTSEIRVAVSVSDSGLTLARSGRPAQALYALDDRLFIRHGVRGFWVFERDSTGAIAALVNWRDNNSVVWRRIPRPSGQ